MIDTSMKPMLASPPKTAARPHDLRGTHAFDLKLDGVRVLAYCEGNGNVTLMNRSGKDVTHRFPEVEAALSLHIDKATVLDGEVVARSGSFQDTALRDKQTKPADVIHAMQQFPVTFVAFDVLFYDDADVRSQPWSWRRELLDVLGVTWDTNALSTSVYSLDPDFFEQVKAKGLEGVIAKRMTSAYRSGRFPDWTKFKAVRSITCIGVGYEKGTGAREHFGAMMLAVVGNDNDIVSVGKVGTGFTASEITTLKRSFDAGEAVLVEIECLNVSKDGKLRFPVYKGLRTDLSMLDATLSQLDQIPRM